MAGQHCDKSTAVDFCAQGIQASTARKLKFQNVQAHGWGRD
jgi:hypothetical protein